MTKRAKAWAGLLAAAACWSACDGPAPAPEPKLVLVSAASSLRDLLTQTARAFENEHAGVEVQYSFDASSTLARQIHEGAPADVFVSADAATVDRIRGDLDAATIVPFLSNRLALVIRDGLDSRPASPRDLIGREGKLALAGPEVPAGKYARAYLRKEGLLEALGSRVVNADNVRATLALVESGAADWGMVYKTDALMAKSASLAWVASEGEDPGVVYVAAVVARSALPEARAFVRVLGSEGFQAAAERLGFRRLR